jgi:hypothetical protein
MKNKLWGIFSSPALANFYYIGGAAASLTILIVTLVLLVG